MNIYLPNLSVISAALMALGRSCLLAKTRRTESLNSSSFNMRWSSSRAVSVREIKGIEGEWREGVKGEKKWGGDRGTRGERVVTEIFPNLAHVLSPNHHSNQGECCLFRPHSRISRIDANIQKRRQRRVTLSEKDTVLDRTILVRTHTAEVELLK